MRNIVVWGQSGGGVFDTFLPAYAQLQGSFSWTNDPKIFHTVGGGIAAYTNGECTRGTGTLVLEIHTRAGLTDLTECVKYGVLAVGGGRFGGVEECGGIALPNKGGNYTAFQVLYLTGGVKTDVISEALGWFQVSLPVEIGEVVTAVPWVDIRPADDEGITLTGFTHYRDGVAETICPNNMDVLRQFRESGGASTMRKLPTQYATAAESESGWWSFLFRVYRSADNIPVTVTFYRDGVLDGEICDMDIGTWNQYSGAAVQLTDGHGVLDIVLAWSVTTFGGKVYRFQDTYCLTVDRGA